MNLEQFRIWLQESFGSLLEDFAENDEYGVNHPLPHDFKTIGYATNLTPEVVAQAADKGVQLLLTHHDAWDFVYGMKEACTKLLRSSGMTHFYVHLPLDFAEFGTCNSLMKELGVSEIVQHTRYVDGREVIGIGQFDDAITFGALTERMSVALGEPVKAWNNFDRPIRRIGMITGAGNSTALMKQAIEADCDAYITGEKTLYSVQYAKFIGMNMIVGSHTFTEIFGVKSLAEKLQAHFPHLKLVRIEEEHLEL